MPDERTRWWTVREFADHYGLSDRSVYDAISAGTLTAHRFGTRRGAIRISEDDRLAWESRCREGSSEAHVE